MVRLDEFCTFSAGGKTRVNKGHYVDEGYPAFSAAGQDGFVENWEYDRPAVVVASIGTCGKAYLATGKWTSLANTYIVFPDTDICHPDYLLHVLDDESSWFVSGSVQPFIKPADIKARKVPLPSFDRQLRIAGILNRAANIERLRNDSARRARDFIPALFLEMFGDPVENPMGWPISTIGETCTVVGGGTPRRIHDEYFGGDIIWATPTDVTALKGFYIWETKEAITEKGLKKSSARLVPVGSVLLTSRATIGYTAIAKAPMTTNQGFANLICGDSLLPEYLSFFLRNRANVLIEMANGTTFKEISKSTLKTVRIPLPPMDLQHRFSAIAARTSRSITAAAAAAGAASALTAALADRLLEESP